MHWMADGVVGRDYGSAIDYRFLGVQIMLPVVDDAEHMTSERWQAAYLVDCPLNPVSLLRSMAVCWANAIAGILQLTKSMDVYL